MNSLRADVLGCRFPGLLDSILSQQQTGPPANAEATESNPTIASPSVAGGNELIPCPLINGQPAVRSFSHSVNFLIVEWTPPCKQTYFWLDPRI
jgi:hypothetical protein